MKNNLNKIDSGDRAKRNRHRKESVFPWVNKKANYLIMVSHGYNMRDILRQVKKYHPTTQVLLLRYDEGVTEKPAEGAKFVRRLKQLKTYIRLRLSGVDRIINLESLRKEINVDEGNLLQLDNILPNLNPMLVYKGFEYSDIVEKKITNGIFPSLVQMAENTVFLNALFQKINPKLVVSLGSRGVSYLLGEVCQYRGVEGICIPHGTPTVAKNHYEEIVNEEIARVICLNKYPTVAVQTKEAEKFFKKNDF